MTRNPRPAGGAYESVFFFVVVVLTDGERIRRYEVFDEDEAEHAVAHFEELRAARET